MNRVTEWMAGFARRSPEAWEAQVVNQWEKSAKQGLFPYLSTDEHGVFAGARLTTFRSNKEWLVVFELPAYVGEAGAFIDRIYAYGNKVKQHVHWIEFLCPPPGDVVGSDQDWLPDLFDFRALLHGRLHRFTFTLEDYARAGVDLDEPISKSPAMDRKAQVLRLLIYLYPKKMFLPESRLLEAVSRPTTLSLFLQTHEWQHPDPRAGETPGNSPCLRSLAQALAHNRPGLYRCPRDMVNTHWSQWPNYFLDH